MKRVDDVGVDGLRTRWLLLGIMLGAWGLRLHELSRQDIWWDEARNIDVALRPFRQVAVAPELDIHPPVYFWLMHFWGKLSGVTMALEPLQIAFLMRFVSVAAGMAGVALLYALALRLAVSRWALAAISTAAIGAFSPFWLAESQEARMYTLGFAILMAAALCFFSYIGNDGHTGVGRSEDSHSEQGGPVLSNGTRRRYWSLVGFGALSALALATHYNAVFILVTWYLWWGAYALLGTRGMRLRELIVAAVTGLGTLLLISPIVPIALRQIPGYANPNLSVPSAGEYLWQNWQAYLAGYAYQAEWLGGLGDLWLGAVLVIFLGGLALLASSAKPEIAGSIRSRFSFVCFWLAGGLALYYVAVLDRGAFNVRYSSFVTPALYVSLAVGIGGWRRLHGWLPVVALAVLLGGFSLGIRADLYDDRYAREDISGVVAWLRERAGPNDVVFVDQKYPFGFYYDRFSIDADKESVGMEAAPARYLFVDINDVDARLTDWSANAEHVFWVQWFESDTDPRHAVSFLLDQEGERVGEEWFRGYSIDWWRLKPPSAYDLASGMGPRVFRFGEAVQTTEVALPDEPVAAGDRVAVVIRWARVPGGRVDRPLKARAALYDTDDGRVAQADTRLLNDRHLLPAEWDIEDRPLNLYSIDVPDDLAQGTYAVRVLVYDAETLEPLSLLDEAGNPVGIEAELGTVQIVSDE